MIRHPVAWLMVMAVGGSAPTAAQSPYRAAAGTISFALVGDAIISRPLSSYDEPDYLRLIEAIGSADVAFANLEIVLQDVAELVPMPTQGGSYMFADPGMAQELAWAGFDMVSRANNHTFDYGVDGMRATTHAVATAGLTQAGVGENLALAEAAGYVETGRGRAALFSTASTIEEFQAAGPQRRDLRGNPGLNPLWYDRIAVLPRSDLDRLAEIASSLGEGPARGDTLRFFGATFVAGDVAAVRTRMRPADKERITRAIAAAKRQADWLIVTTHTHEGAPGQREVPAEFLVEYARMAVDAGADVFVGHGPHVLRGIEIYKDKPIFYSLGNFLFENETVQFRPGAEVVRTGVPAESHTVDYYDARQQQSNGYFTTDSLAWESVVALPTFEGGELKQVRLLPIVLGYGETRARRGRPIVAPPEKAREIIERLDRLSMPFGTRVTFENGQGWIRREETVEASAARD